MSPGPLVTRPRSASRFQLRGEVDGTERSFPLLPGTNHVGSLDVSNELVLPARGVSRCHAEIEVEADAVTVRDLGSKNGTFVDGVRVSEAPAQIGSEIRIGSISLRLIADEGESAAGEPGPETEVDFVRPQGDDGVLQLLESVLERFAASDLEGALGWLAESMGSRGGWLARWSGPEDLREIAAVGEGERAFTSAPVRNDFVELLSQPLPEGTCRVVPTESGESLLCAVLVRSGGERIGLALWGTASTAGLPGRVARVFLRMVDAFFLTRLPAAPPGSGASL